MQLKCRLNQATTCQMAAKKPLPSRRKPPKTDLAPDATPSCEVSYDILGSFFQAILAFCNLQAAFCNLQAYLPAPWMPAISRDDFPSQTRSDSANSRSFSGHMRFPFPETQEALPSPAFRRTHYTVYHNGSYVSSSADRIIPGNENR